MIALTRLDGSVVHVNADLVAQVETHHDTVVTLSDGRVVVAQEDASVVCARVADFRGRVLASARRFLDLADDPGALAALDGPDEVVAPEGAAPRLVVVSDAAPGAHEARADDVPGRSDGRGA